MARETSPSTFLLCNNTTGDSCINVLAEEKVAWVLCSPPENLTETSQTLTAINLNWQYTAGTRYQVQWKEITQENWSQTSVLCCSAIYYLSGLQFGKIYQWKVRAICSDGSLSDWSAERTFTMSCPVSPGQSEQISPTRARLSWIFTIAPNGQSLTYNIQWRPYGSTTWTTISNVCCVSTLENLTKGQSYEWQIQTNCPDGSTSAYSSPRTFTASCGAPTALNANSITSTGALLSWYTVSTATYAIQYRPRVTPTADWSLVTGITSSQYRLEGLINGLTYEWQVQTLCSAEDSSPFSATSSFTTNCSTPFLYTPTASAQGAEIRWENYGLGVQYNIIYRPLSSPLSTTISNVTTNSYSLSGLTNGTAYQVQLQLICANGNSSGISSPVSFTTNCNPPASGNTLDVYGSGITWQSIGFGVNYELQYRQQGANDWPISLTTSTNSLYLPNLSPQTSYQWRVRTLCADGSQSGWSSIFSFTTRTCTTPSDIYATDVEGGSVLLNTTGGTSGDNYLLQWRPLGITEWNSLTMIGYSVRLTGLSNGTTYEWRLQKLCSEALSSAFSAVRTFTTACTLPIVRGESYVSNTIAEVYWSAQLGVSYRVRWRQTGATAWVNSSTVTAYHNGYLFYKLPITLTEGNRYEWQIQTICSDESFSAFSGSRTFVSTCGTIGFINYLNISLTKASIYWGGPTAGIAYELRWRVQGTTTWTGSATALSNTYTLTGLTSNTSYEVQVRPICDSSLWSNTSSFKTLSSCIFINNALLIREITSHNITIHWGDNSDIYGFTLWWRISGTIEYNAVSSLVTTPYTLTGLTPNTNYELFLYNSCMSTGTVRFQTPPLLTLCSAIYTISDGNWTDPATWSCGRIPTSSDAIEIRHAVTIPANMTGNAQRVNYVSGGRIVSEAGAKLQLGFP